jgi:hypothetical protein
MVISRGTRILTSTAPLFAVLVLVAGCSSSPDEPKTFHEDGFAVTFKYPRELERSTDVTFAHSVGPEAETVALAKSEDNLIAVQRFALSRPVAEEDADALRQQLDKMIGRLSGAPADGKRIDAGGLMAFRYEIEQLETPEDGRSTIIALFDRATEYVINCQSVPDGRDELARACERVIDTLEPTSG